MYGKLINGRLVPAPNPLHINRGLVYNPSSYLYEAVGYRLVVDTPQPEQPEDDAAVYPRSFGRHSRVQRRIRRCILNQVKMFFSKEFFHLQHGLYA